MLYPQTNEHRTVLDLSGIWEIRVDEKDRGEENGWLKGFSSQTYIGVPGSWNEQLAEMGLMNYVGKIWYQKKFSLPALFQGKKIYLRFGCANYSAKVWINGHFAVEDHGGYLPFEADISDLVSLSDENILVVSVDNRLSHDTIPQGLCESDFLEFQKERELTFPATIFDFFSYGGIERPVKLSAVYPYHIQDISLDTDIKGDMGIIYYQVLLSAIETDMSLIIEVYDHNEKISQQTQNIKKNIINGTLNIERCKLWDMDEPNLYELKFKLFQNQAAVDSFKIETGVRTIAVEKDRLLLNGKPIFLRGFGKHEDFAVLGKGLSYPLAIKDFQMMKWIGANSFRTAHYPYAEEIMQIADKMGFLVIDEVPAVSLNFRFVNDKTLGNHKRALTDLITRDRNHPSVIAWSIANEPGIWGEEEAISPEADNYWHEIYTHVKKMDTSRPVTLPACAKWGLDDLSYKYSDFISINRYWGWYEIPGDIKKAGIMLEKELNQLFERYKKPIMLTEFGADTVEGLHATYPQMFTEEYQTELTLRYFEIIEKLPFTIGEHIWNFADFRTAQHFRRVVLNKKGIFNRQRDPKSAAFAIRKHWKKDS